MTQCHTFGETKMQAIANKIALFAACDKAVAGRQIFIAEVIAAGYPTLEAARPHVMEYVSSKTGCKINTKDTGRVVFDGTDTKLAQDSRDSLRELMLWLSGTTRRKHDAANKAASPEVSRKAAPLTKAQKAAVEALIAAFGGDRKAARAAV